MFFSAVVRTSRTTYRGSSGSGAGASSKTSFRSSPASRSTLRPSVLAGQNYKQSQRGLFEAVLPQSGNTIPKSRQKTARTWRPNVQNKHLYSDILGKSIKTRVTTRALRTVRKYGGLDAYLARRDKSILGAWGRSMRDTIASTLYTRGFGDQVEIESAAKLEEIKAEKDALEAQRVGQRMQAPGLSRSETGLSSTL